MIFDALYQVLLGSCGAALLVGLRRHRQLPLKLVLGVPGFAALILAAALGRDLFDLMRLMGHAVFFHAPLALMIAALLIVGTRRKAAAACVTLALLLVAIYVDAYHIEPERLETTHVRVAAPAGQAPLRIAVLADIQTDRVGPYEQQTLATALAERPDLLLLPGDFLQIHGPERPAQVAALRALFRELTPLPPRGIWAVGGNVDPPGWEQIFEGTAVRTMVSPHTAELGDGLYLTGLDLDASFDHKQVIARPAGARYHVVFGHAPDFALGRVEADLLVAGHTHGGQVQLPLIGPLITLSGVPNAWASGVTELGAGKTLVVSRGVGLERGNAPRMRFLCRPELVIVEVKP